mgnify:CR=1 FL=1
MACSETNSSLRCFSLSGLHSVKMFILSFKMLTAIFVNDGQVIVFKFSDQVFIRAAKLISWDVVVTNPFVNKSLNVLAGTFTLTTLTTVDRFSATEMQTATLTLPASTLKQ